MNRRYRGPAGGFTLVELMLVVGVLVVIGSLAVVGYTRVKRGIDKEAALVLVNQTSEAVDIYYAAMNDYPDGNKGLQALIDPPDDQEEAKIWRDKGGPFLKDRKIPKDPWRTEVKYMRLDDADSSALQYRVYSFGPNKTDDQGGEDDIPNWAEEAGG